MSLSDVITELEDSINSLRDLERDPEDAVSTLDSVAYELERQSNELTRISSVVADAMSILS